LEVHHAVFGSCRGGVLQWRLCPLSGHQQGTLNNFFFFFFVVGGEGRGLVEEGWCGVEVEEGAAMFVLVCVCVCVCVCLGCVYVSLLYSGCERERGF
jgi:hypothetical protein